MAETGYISRFIDESFKNLGVRRSTKLMVVLGDSLDYCIGVVSKDNPNTSKGSIQYCATMCPKALRL